MAKMHTRRKGKSSSKNPHRVKVQEWQKITREEVINIILDLWKQGLSTSKIGIVLRDKYGVGDVNLIIEQSITEVLRDNKIYPKIPEDLSNLMMKTIRLRKHLNKNKKDLHNKRSLQLTESKVRRLVKYYHRKDILPKEWNYKPETAEVMLTK